MIKGDQEEGNTSLAYGYDRVQAKIELAYRKGLKAELDQIGNRLDTLGN
jgi:hypothetical protein